MNMNRAEFGMSNWDDLRFCLAVHRSGTMSGAASMLGTNVATVSRRLQRLADQYGQPLFIKAGNRWAATELGSDLADLAEQTELKLRETVPEPGQQTTERRLRISCAMQILQCGLVPGLGRFSSSHPYASFRLTTAKQSLALNECDIRIGFEQPTEGRIVRRLLTMLDLAVACRTGSECDITDWVDVLYLPGLSLPAAEALRAHFGRPAKVEIEGLNLTRSLLLNGPYVAALPRQYLNMQPDLVECPIDRPMGSLPVWISYHEGRRKDPVVRMAIEFLEQVTAYDDAAEDSPPEAETETI